MRVTAFISALAAIAAILLFVVSETSPAPLNLPLEQVKWRYFMGVLVLIGTAGWASNRARIIELEHEVSAVKQEIRDVCKLATGSRASL